MSDFGRTLSSAAAVVLPGGYVDLGENTEPLIGERGTGACDAVGKPGLEGNADSVVGHGDLLFVVRVAAAITPACSTRPARCLELV